MLVNSSLGNGEKAVILTLFWQTPSILDWCPVASSLRLPRPQSHDDVIKYNAGLIALHCMGAHNPKQRRATAVRSELGIIPYSLSPKCKG